MPMQSKAHVYIKQLSVRVRDVVVVSSEPLDDVDVADFIGVVACDGSRFMDMVSLVVVA